jgi:hypothetical protein
MSRRRANVAARAGSGILSGLAVWMMCVSAASAIPEIIRERVPPGSSSAG